ncbi:MAG: response regulator [Spirochaetaceae bacterium]|nr:response regulator [Spirochaetaceae bacterium]
MDDEVEVLESIKRAFRNVPNLIIFTTADPHEALEIIRYEPVYLLITDQRMPEVLGTDLLQQAGEIAPHIELGILTAFADVQLAQLSINELRVRYLFSKPFENSTLVREVVNAVRNVDKNISTFIEHETVKQRNRILEASSSHTMNNESYELRHSLADTADLLKGKNRQVSELEQLFDSFLRALIEEKGYCDADAGLNKIGLATLSVSIAEMINERNDGVFENTFLSSKTRRSLYYAAVLIELAKVFFRPDAYTAQQKLAPQQMAHLMLKLDYLYRYYELIYSEQKIQLMNSGDEYRRYHLINEVEVEKEEQLQRIQKLRKTLQTLNDSAEQAEEVEEKVKKVQAELESFKVRDIQGNRFAILTVHETAVFSAAPGWSMDQQPENLEQLVQFSQNLIDKIDWPTEYTQIPMIINKYLRKLNARRTSAAAKRGTVDLCADIIAAANLIIRNTDRNQNSRPFRVEAAEQDIDQDIIDLCMECNEKPSE